MATKLTDDELKKIREMDGFTTDTRVPKSTIRVAKKNEKDQNKNDDAEKDKK